MKCVKWLVSVTAETPKNRWWREEKEAIKLNTTKKSYKLSKLVGFCIVCVESSSGSGDTFKDLNDVWLTRLCNWNTWTSGAAFVLADLAVGPQISNIVTFYKLINGFNNFGYRFD